MPENKHVVSMHTIILPLGILLIAAGEFLTFVHILPWSRYVFPLCWYGYVLVVEALNQRIHGSSLMSRHPKELLLMLPASAFYWYIFEWYNLVIQNWTYLNGPSEKWLELTLKIVSFATVIPAVFQTTDLVAGSAWMRNLPRIEVPKWPGWHLPTMLLGLVLSLLPLLWPRWFFWAVWLGLFFLLDPINDRLGRPSICRDWLSGDFRRTMVLLSAGYICGFFWEFWNYWAYTKWVYTVPIPDMPYLFEMPVLGFLGFGPFALETFTFWTLLWKESGTLRPPHYPASRVHS